jgi:chromosome segregation ATPase
MPDERLDLDRFAVENRVRIENVEAELSRSRDRLHQMESEYHGVNLTLQTLRDLPAAVRELSAQLQTLSTRAVERPRAATVTAWAAWLSALVSTVAIILAIAAR